MGKLFFKSKTFWLGVLTILVAIQDLLVDFNLSNMDTKEYIMLVIGILIILIRYFTNEPMTFKKPK